MANNATIGYDAKRKLRPGVLVDDAIEFDVGVYQFEPSVRNDVKTAAAMGGRVKRSYYFSDKMWQVSIRTVDRALAEEFFYSVVAGERFYVTNVDETDRIMTCELMNSSWTYRRVSTSLLDEFEYGFTVKEIEDDA